MIETIFSLDGEGEGEEMSPETQEGGDESQGGEETSSDEPQARLEDGEEGETSTEEAEA